MSVSSFQSFSSHLPTYRMSAGHSASASSADSVLPPFRTPEGGTARAVEMLFTNRITAAEQYLLTCPTVEPARAKLLLAYCSFVQAMSSYLENILDVALARVWEAEAVGKKAKSLSGQVVQGDAYLLGAILQFVQGSYIKGAWNIKNSWSYYKSASTALETYTGPDRDELLCACRCGTGFFNLMVSLLPPTIIAVASWIGFSGDREKGLDDLRAAVHSNQTMSPFAAMMLLSYLCGMSTMLGDLDDNKLAESRELLAWADERYPRSIIFSWVKVRYFRTMGMMREAVECAEDAVQQNTEFPVLNLFSYFQQGWCSFVLLELEPSARYFSLMLQDDTAGSRNSVKASYSYHAGTALSIQAFLIADQDPSAAAALNAKAREHYLATPGFVDPKRTARDIEVYSVRRSKERLEGRGHPVLDGLELMYIFACFDTMPAGAANGVFELLERCEADIAKRVSQNSSSASTFEWPLEDQCRLHLVRGCVLHALKRDHEALESFQQLLAHEKALKKSARAKSDGLLAFCHSFLSQHHLRSNRFAEARASLSAAKDASGHDLPRMLNFRFHSFEKSIEKAERSSSK